MQLTLTTELTSPLILGPRGIATPAQILGATLKGWWTADNVANTIINTDQFSAVPDLSGNGNDLEGGGNTGGEQNPTIAAAPINGHRSFDFSPTTVSRFIIGPNAGVPGVVVPEYLFGIIRPTSGAILDTNRFWISSTGSTVAWIQTRDDSGSGLVINAYNGGSAGATAQLSDDHVYAFTASFLADGTITLRMSDGTTSTINDTGTGGTDQIIIGTGGGFGVNDTAQGQGLEFGVANAIPSTANDNAVMAYLKSRAGI